MTAHARELRTMLASASAQRGKYYVMKNREPAPLAAATCDVTAN